MAYLSDWDFDHKIGHNTYMYNMGTISNSYYNTIQCYKTQGSAMAYNATQCDITQYPLQSNTIQLEIICTKSPFKCN